MRMGFWDQSPKSRDERLLRGTKDTDAWNKRRLPGRIPEDALGFTISGVKAGATYRSNHRFSGYFRRVI
jgi:hypothetical protein